MQPIASPFARRDSPFPSGILRADIRLRRGSVGSNTTSLGLRARSSDVTISQLLPDFEPYEGQDDDEFELLRLDGLASMWHPDRQMMVPMVCCIWKDFPADWQPLECVPPLNIIEYIRRSQNAHIHLTRMLEKEPHTWRSPTPQVEKEAEVLAAYPGHPNYDVGEVPDEPATPRRVFTTAEISLGDSTARKWERHMQATAPYPTVLQVESSERLVLDTLARLSIVNHGHLTINVTTQTAKEGGMIVGEDMTVRADTINSVEDVGGQAVIVFGDNTGYKPELAGQ